MTTLKHKIKINNSYESEPSSGSGSSLGEHNDYPIYDDENMHLPYLLKPPSFEIEEVVITSNTTTTTAALAPPATNVMPNPPLMLMNKSVAKERKLRYEIPLHSSEESSFEGFSDSPFGKVQRRFDAKLLEMPKMEPTNCSRPLTKGPFDKYLLVIGEDSCNAVDMQLSNEPDRHPSFSSGNNADSNDDNPNPSLELSFNGKIKSLTSHLNVTEPIEMLPTTSRGLPGCLPTLFESSLNNSQFNSDSFVLKKFSNEKSPDLFGEDDDDDDDDGDGDDNPHHHATNSTFADLAMQSKVELDSSVNKSINCPTESSFADDQTYDGTIEQFGADANTLLRNNCRREKEILRRIHKCLAGVPPPPSLTIPQLDMFSAVLSRKDEILNFHDATTAESENNSSNACISLYKPTHSLEQTKLMPWKEILGVRQHGLSFNLNKASESNEYLNLAVIERFIGAETASSYRNSPSSAKKRNSRLKLLTQSPGNRLSHLAKRRAVFSSANLATQKSCSSVGPQILIDKKKSRHRRKATPKRMTPGSKMKMRKTPTSSARKRLFRCDLIKPGPSRETSKRALFQSPAKHFEQRHAAPKISIKPEIANRVEKSKRALFSPDRHSLSSTNSSSLLINQNQSYFSQPHQQQTSSYFDGRQVATSMQLESLLKRKRNTADDDDAMELATQSSKLFRGSAENLTPRALKIKSQSFCSGAGSSAAAAKAATITSTATGASIRNLNFSSSQLGASSGSLVGSKFTRAHSDMSSMSGNSLTENQRKKLLWAVSQALQEKKITAKHESFKQYASVLARVVRRVFQEFYQKSSTSNSETMLRLSKKYVYNVISGKNADDIYFNAKAQIDETNRQSFNRLSGYIGPEEYQQRKNSQQLFQSQNSQQTMGSMQNLFATENSIDSFSMSISQTSSSAFGASSIGISVSQCSFLDRVSQDSNARSTTKQQQPHQLQQQQQIQLPIQPNPSLQNSSSKNNLGGLALRENVDCEQRRSAQKNFTGKDQRNVSPYAVLSSSSTATAVRLGSGLKAYPPTQHFMELNASGAKAKRQISFDS